MKRQLRQRLVIGLTGLVMGTVSVAAEGGELDEHASAVAQEATLTINEAPIAVQALPVASPTDGRDDNQ